MIINRKRANRRGKRTEEQKDRGTDEQKQQIESNNR